MRTSKPSTGRLFPPQYKSIDKGHGRLETRTIRTTTALNAYLEFPHIAQVALVERDVTVLKTGKRSLERAWLITDLTPAQAPPVRLLALNRGHWSIENRLHWVRDVTFDEDRCQVRTGHGPRVLASIRNFIIGLCRRMITSPRTSIPSVLRYFAARPAQALAVFIG